MWSCARISRPGLCVPSPTPSCWVPPAGGGVPGPDPARHRRGQGLPPALPHLPLPPQPAVAHRQWQRVPVLPAVRWVQPGTRGWNFQRLSCRARAGTLIRALIARERHGGRTGQGGHRPEGAGRSSRSELGPSARGHWPRGTGLPEAMRCLVWLALFGRSSRLLGAWCGPPRRAVRPGCVR